MRIVVWGTGITGIMTARMMMQKGHEVRLVDEKMPVEPISVLSPKVDAYATIACLSFLQSAVAWTNLTNNLV